MTGVLVDDQAFGHDPISHGFLIDSTFSTTPVSSCAGSYTHLHSPLSQHQASYHQISPHLLRSISSPDWKGRELNQLLPQISPLLHSRSQGLASFDADASCDSMKQGTSLNLGGGRGGAEDFAAKAFVHELGAKAVAKAAFEVPTLDAALFGGLCGAEFKSAQAPFFASDVGSKIGAHCSGTEADEQGLRSPFSCGTPLWSQSIGGSLAGSPTLPDAILALQKFLPSNLEDDEGWPAVDVYTCDEFRMFEFKVRRCMRGRSHDWTECPFAHPGEKARRRDPRRFHYSGIACPDFRKGNCKRGDTCEYAHGVFECWLHPARYRTQPCKDGTSCKRRVCFFAHTPEQLRLLPAAAQAASRTGGHPSSPRSSFTQKLAQCPSYDGSPLRAGMGVSAEATIQTIDVGASPPSPGVERQSFDRIAPRCNGSIGRGTNMNFYYFGSSPLSPPLSPSGSPPPSPGTPVEWPSSCLATTAPVTQVSGSVSQAGVSQLQASVGLPMRSMPGNSSSSVHRRHLDRLNSMPSLPILSSDLRRPYLPLSSMPSSPHASSGTSILSSKQMSELIATIKHLELAGAEPYWLPTQDVRASQMAASRCSSGPSPLSHSASVPSTPRWPTWIDSEGEFWGSMEKDGGPCLERVESGWCLRAKIYENLMMKGSQKDSLDDQDVGWVNELVKEETYQK